MPGESTSDPQEPSDTVTGPDVGAIRVSVSVPTLVIAILFMSPALVEGTVLHPSPFWAVTLALAIWRSPAVRLSFELSQNRGLSALRKVVRSEWVNSLLRKASRRVQQNASKLVDVTREDREAGLDVGHNGLKVNQHKDKSGSRTKRKRPGST